jgi:5'-nucleotidase
LSNIIDNTTGKIPKGLHEFYVLERRGLKIGFIGLVEKYVPSAFTLNPPSCYVDI